MTLAELESALAETVGASFVTITAEVDPRMRKTGNPYVGRVVKRSRVNGVINWSYESSVNRERCREDGDPDFEAHPRKWGLRVKGSPFVKHNGKTYLEMKVQRVMETEYLLDGEKISKSLIEKFLPKPKAEGARQDVEKPVILRDYNLDTIRAIKFSGADFKIENHKENVE